MKKDKKSLPISLLADRILIQSEQGKGEQKTSSGIIVPGKGGDQKLEIGKVVAVGKGRRANDGTLVPSDVHVSDRVYFKRGYDVEEIEIEGKTYVLLSESNILAIID